MLDPQMKRGLLETCILSVLLRGDSYGYQILKDLSSCITVSESTLYPILRRLEANGSLTEYTVVYNSRLRKFYKITETGKRQVQDFLQNWDELERMYRFIEEGTRHDEN